MSEKLELPKGMPELRVMPMPADANVHGDVFGGWIMSQVDIAGSLPAVRRANGRVATIAVNSFIFKQPVFVGDLLSFYAMSPRSVALRSRSMSRCMRNAIVCRRKW